MALNLREPSAGPWTTTARQAQGPAAPALSSQTWRPRCRFRLCTRTGTLRRRIACARTTRRLAPPRPPRAMSASEGGGSHRTASRSAPLLPPHPLAPLLLPPALRTAAGAAWSRCVIYRASSLPRASFPSIPCDHSPRPFACTLPFCLRVFALRVPLVRVPIPSRLLLTRLVSLAHLGSLRPWQPASLHASGPSAYRRS